MKLGTGCQRFHQGCRAPAAVTVIRLASVEITAASDELSRNRVNRFQALAETGNGFAIFLQLAIREEANLKV